MMKPKRTESRIGLWLGVGVLSVAATLVSAAAPACAAGAQEASFTAPDQAVEALIAANRSGRTEEILKILGPASEQLINSGDPVADKAGRNRFVAAYDAAHKLESRGSGKMILVIGKEAWPFPIPLVREGAAWHFDTEAGEREILDRRIGRNELNVIAVCRAYVEAQREYAAKDRLGTGTLEYAQHFLSSPGTHNGLYWPAKSGEESPLGPLMASARAEGYDGKTPHSEPRPFHGYYYKILTKQGPNAPGGARNYVVDGHMTGGFALVAFPARYGDSGVMTFVVNQDGIVYEKDLGADTPTAAGKMTVFNPDTSWKIP